MNLILSQDLRGETVKTVRSPTEYAYLNVGDVLISSNVLKKINEYLDQTEKNTCQNRAAQG